MKTTKKQLKEIQQIEKEVSKVCDVKETTQVTKDDNGIVINKETGEPHFSENSKSNNSRDIEITLCFGLNAPKISVQLKEQGYKISKHITNIAEKVRVDLLALNEIGVLSDKQLIKCFRKFSTQITSRVVNSIIKDSEIAIHKKTILVK